MTPLVMREQGSGTRTTFEAALAAIGIDVVPPLMEFGSTAAVREAVFAADAPAVLSSLAVQRDLADRRLVRVPVSGVSFPRTLRAVWNPRRRPRGLAAEEVGPKERAATMPVTNQPQNRDPFPRSAGDFEGR